MSPRPVLPDAEPTPQGSVPAPSLGALFLVTLKVGLFSFGGGISGWLYQAFVVRNGWISDDDFASSLAISQVLPGANVINLIICLGDQLRGLAGVMTGLLGFLVGPFFAVIALSVVFHQVTDIALMQAVSSGVAFAAMGLMIVICWRGIRRSARHASGPVIIAVTAIAVGVLKISLILVVLVVASASVALAWRRG